MQMQLIDGSFQAKDAIDILTQMVEVKIKYHERQIGLQDAEEDVQWRERRIMELQRELQAMRALIEEKGETVRLEAAIGC